jgi:hypothetical protein
MILVLGTLGISAGSAAGQDAASEVRSEIDRLQRTVNDKPAADPGWQRARPELSGLLSRARASLQAGRLYLSLEELARARTTLRALESVKESRAAKSGMPGFETAWKKTSRELATIDRKAPASARGKAPAAFRALAETAEGQTTVLLQASRSYAEVTSADAGFYYMGEARAAAESARFCASLGAARPLPPLPLPLRSVAPELRRLQERTVAAFTPPRSLQHHGDFIGLNATLKLAGELDGAGLYAGALYQYLDAVQQLGRLDGATPDAAKQAGLRATLAGLRTRLRASPEDDSIAELFLERAEALLGDGKGAAPGADAWTNAAVLAEQVLPAYLSWRQPAPVPNLIAGHPIAVTLVRWPYT